jgi:hypothetical protein
MSYRLIEPRDYPSAEMIHRLTLDARRERAEAVMELFGFGFRALKNVVRLRPATEKPVALDAAVGKGI